MSEVKVTKIESARLVDSSSRIKAFNEQGQRLSNYTFITIEASEGKTINTWVATGNAKILTDNQKKDLSSSFNGILIDLPSLGVNIYPQDPKGNLALPNMEHPVQTLLSLVTVNSLDKN